MNGKRPFFKWILILIFLWGITKASSAASTQFVANDPIQTFNVTKGTDAVIRFDNLEYHQSATPYFTLTYTSEEQPFCCQSHVYNTLINSGLRAQDQEGRFSVGDLLVNDTFSVFLNIIDVSVQDGGRIELVFMLLNYIEHIYVARTAMVNVFIPPPKAKCDFSRITIIGHHYHVVRCQVHAENGKVTLSCFQTNSKISPIDIITDNNDRIRGTFWARFGDKVKCCSHLTTDNVTQETCDHSIFHHPKSITIPISNNSSPETTESPFHLDSMPTTIIGTTNSSDQICVFMPWIPLYLRIIILAYISLSSLMYSEFSLNRHNAI